MAARSNGIRRSAVAAGLALVLSMGLAACSEDEVSTDGCTVVDPAEAGRTEVSVTAKNMQFRERCFEVEPGSLGVTFTNDDSGIAHNFRLKGQGVDEATELKSGTYTDEITIDLGEPGVYDFMCDPHPQMTGKIVVVDPEAPAASETSDPSAS